MIAETALRPEAPQPAGVGSAGLQLEASLRLGELVVRDDGACLEVAISEGADPETALELQRQFARPLALRVAMPGPRDRPGGASPRGPRAQVSATIVARLLAAILTDAVRRGASAVHFEPFGAGMVIRQRRAGLLVETLHLSAEDGRALVAHIRERAGIPGDGGAAVQAMLSLPAGLALPDVRVATLPGSHGDRVVLRFAASDRVEAALRQLGMAATLATATLDALAQGGGLLLVAGAPRSGRRTTLRALLEAIDCSARSVFAVSERREPPIAGVTQTLADPARGFPTAAALEAVLHQDPDVVLVSAIEDAEAATAALRAARAGHLVLAGVTANDAVDAIVKLRAMRLDRHQLAASLRLVLAQRLVRRLCPECRRPTQATGSVSALLGFDSGAIVYGAQGCEACGETGFAGRTGVFEGVVIDAALRRLVSDGGDAPILARHAFVNAPNFGSAARALVREGVTTAEEAVRISRASIAAVLR